MMPLVSVIINCHNGERFLREAIDSIYCQTLSDWEIIFWDNASNDKSASIAKSYDKKLKYFLALKKTPLGEARNLAMRKASGKYIAFLDCDDIYMPNKIEKQIHLMEENNYVMSYGSGLTINEEGNEIKRISVKNSSGYVFDALLNHYEIGMQSVMLLKSYLLKNKLEFDTNFSYCPDYNLFMIIACEKPVGILKDFIVKDRVVKNSLQYSKQSINIAGSEVRVTLDAISKKYPDLEKKYTKDFKQAYGKSKFYDIVELIYLNDIRKARFRMKALIYLRYEFFLLYLILFLPLPNKFILKLIGR